jgi:pimeloyl-ACP methyl ester carboxylesterase
MTIVAQQPAASVKALPMAWFDYSAPLRSVPKNFRRIDARDGGGEITYFLSLDGRPIPFKFICDTKTAGGRAGEKRPVLVMLPGMGLTPPTYHGVGPYLFATHDLLLVDYPSLWQPHLHPREGLSLRLMARSVWMIANALQLETFDLAGSSMGGGLCLVATLNPPMPEDAKRIRRLVLSNPACYPQKLPDMYTLMQVPLVGNALARAVDVNKLLEGLLHIGYVDPAKFPQDVRACYTRVLSKPEGRAVLMRLIRQLPADAREFAPHVPRLHEITQPVLIAWGIQDKLVIPANGLRLANDLPNSKYAEFADLSHMPHEESPERVGPLWAEFLNR